MRGGLGGPGRLRETRLLARAIMQGWTLPQNRRVKVLRALLKVVDPDADHGERGDPGHREMIAAARALMHADIEQQKIDLAAKQSDSPAVRDALSDAEARDDGYEPPRPPAPDEERPAEGPPGEVP